MRIHQGGSVKSFLLLLLLLLPGTEGCGPGRGSGRRRRPRKLTPLVFKQHVPNVSENTLGASGLTDGKIRRTDPKFKDLVRNNNPDILFKDEEGTGADRIMSQRCKDKLNTLAISVLNQWPGVKLRVTEAWDEDNMHADNSLHYEGRAVDITTSDRDRSKYGMLARLAVEAGFDWVYYETRGHIHCSVKSDSSVAIKIGGCFPMDSLVTTTNGQTISMADLKVGDEVLTMDNSGQLRYSEVIAFLDRSSVQMALYYTLTTESGRQVTLTAKHLIYVLSEDLKSRPSNIAEFTSTSFSPYHNDGHRNDPKSPELGRKYPTGSLTPTFAEDIKVGEYVLLAEPEHNKDGESCKQVPKAIPQEDNISRCQGQPAFDSIIRKDLNSPNSEPNWFTKPERVISVETRTSSGVYAPLTSEGTIVVDGVVTSCYAFLHDTRLAHTVLAPLRWYHVIKTHISDWLSYSGLQADWMNYIISNTSSTTLQEGNSTSVSQENGAHWYAKTLYSIAVNVLGMDINISM